MKYVIDSCVAFKWLVPEVDTDKALVLRDDCRRAAIELLAPDVFPIEMTHALTRAERQGRVSPVVGSLLLKTLLFNLPELHPQIPLLARAYAISSQTRQGAYDSLYIALAEREGCELVTADDKLVRTLQPLFPFIRSLSSFP